MLSRILGRLAFGFGVGSGRFEAPLFCFFGIRLLGGHLPTPIYYHKSLSQPLFLVLLVSLPTPNSPPKSLEAVLFLPLFFAVFADPRGFALERLGFPGCQLGVATNSARVPIEEPVVPIDSLYLVKVKPWRV